MLVHAYDGKLEVLLVLVYTCTSLKLVLVACSFQADLLIRIAHIYMGHGHILRMHAKCMSKFYRMIITSAGDTVYGNDHIPYIVLSYGVYPAQ